MQLPISSALHLSTNSDVSAKMAVDTSTSPQPLTPGVQLSRVAVNHDVWTRVVLPANPKVLPDCSHKFSTASRGRLPSIEEIQAPPRSTFPAQGDFSQMFISNNNAIFVKRRTPPLVQHSHSGYRPVKNQIIRHSLSDSNLRSRVEPLPDNAQHHQLQNGLLERVNVRPSPARVCMRQSATAATNSLSSILSARRDTVTIDGKIRRVRFLSADHTPLREDPEFRKLLMKDNTNEEEEAKLKPNADKNLHLRTVTVAHGRKGVLDLESATSRSDSKKETPDVWLERARNLRAAKDKSNNAVKVDTNKSKCQKFHEEEEKLSKKNASEIVVKHVNFCNAKKTAWIVSWLEEVNKQTHFEVIE